MDFLLYLLQRMWAWLASNGLTIIALLILIVLIPRIRRFIIAVATANLVDGEEESKGRRALIGAVVYIAEIIAYFVVIIALLNSFGVSLTAAAIPATVISAAVGFGAQGLIGDFLGGVFIIAEKQYGIGDWVEFHTPSGTVQGDVVSVTLRATTIRTLNGEEVVIPNSEARMCVNYSSRWSRAVIEVPVPMTAGGSVRDLEERTMAAARRGVAADGVREHVLSDIRIQSSTKLNPPSAIGQPWTVSMRLLVDCEPGNQWLVERAVRSEIIDTWWDDYGERASEAPLKAAGFPTAATAAMLAAAGERADEVGRGDLMTSPVARSRAWSRDEVDDGTSESDGSLEVEQAQKSALAADAAGGGSPRRRSDVPDAGARLDDEYRRAKDAGADDEELEAIDGDAVRRRDDAPTEVLAPVGAATAAGSTAETTAETTVDSRVGSTGDGADSPADGDDDADADGKKTEKLSSADAIAAGGSWKDLTNRQRVRRVFSAGGRARPSTVVMLVALLLLGMLNLAMFEPGEDQDGPAGWLAPSRFIERGEGDNGDAEETGTGTGRTDAPTTAPQEDQREDRTGTGEGTDGTGTGTGQRPGTGTGTGDTGTGTGTGDTGTGTGGDTGTGTGGTDGGTGTDTGTGTGTGDTGTGTGTGTGGTGDGTATQ